MNEANFTRSLLPVQADDALRFYLYEIKLQNWGLFNNTKVFPIARDGYIFAGPSGAGKSTAMDAHAALVTPPHWVAFNQAARTDRGEDRSLVTYVRGTWGEKTSDKQEVSSQCLRPDSTWSAISESYRNDLNQTVTLLQVFWLKGRSNATKDLGHVFFIFERPFDFEELKPFVEGQFKKSVAEHLWPGALIDSFEQYQEKFRPLLGIPSKATLRLLHKTQSTKDMGDLNNFVREFMLEEPGTFELARTLVEKFQELDAAFKAVLDAQAQIDTLKPVRANHLEHEEGKAQQAAHGLVVRNADAFMHQREGALLAVRLESVTRELAAEELKITAAQGAAAERRGELGALEARYWEMGGGTADELRRRRGELVAENGRRIRRRERFEEDLVTLDIEIPDTYSPEEFLRCKAEAEQVERALQAQAKKSGTAMRNLGAREAKLNSDLEDAGKEIRALEAQRSNVPYQLTELRALLSKELGINITELPFAGELMQVKRSQAAEWSGAIERLLGGLGKTMLVADEDAPAVSKWVDDRNLGLRLKFTRVVEQQAGNQNHPARAVVHKLDFADGDLGEWLREEVKRLYPHECVDSIEELKKVRAGLTRAGQIKRGTDHEKDDRRNITDRRGWVLGFSNEEKKQEFLAHLDSLLEQQKLLKAEIEEETEQRELWSKRERACAALRELIWGDIDAGSITGQIRSTDQLLDKIEDENPDLAVVERNLADARKAVDKADGAVNDLKVQAGVLENRRREVVGKVTALDDALLQQVVQEAVGQTLSALLTEVLVGNARLGTEVTLENLKDVHRLMDAKLGEIGSQLRLKQQQCENNMLAAMRAYLEKEVWKAQIGADASLASVPDFIDRLRVLEEDNLPKFKDRFEKMLNEQALQHLAALSQQLRAETRSVREKVELVNDALGTTEFNKGTYIKLGHRARQIPDVTDFITAMRGILEMVVDDPEVKKARFIKLRQLVSRLSSGEPHDQRWRKLVLDVRQHLEFYAIESDAAGVQVQTYSGSSGKSGGERQKLTMTILAAALRYQLSGDDGDFPRYSTIMVDEAFDKADPEFTKTAMQIFKRCGFQVIAATPMKGIMALDEFIGGAAYIYKIKNVSYARLLEYDVEKRELVIPKEVRAQVAAEEALSEAAKKQDVEGPAVAAPEAVK
jgi:uncharacterized protein YPO0396